MDNRNKPEPKNRDLEHACPPLDGALPSWPAQMRKKMQWIGLHGAFKFSHQSSSRKDVDYAAEGVAPENIAARHEAPGEHYFCAPMSQMRRLKSIIKDSDGGSVLITGYRGTGKTSFVNHALSELIKEDTKARNLTQFDKLWCWILAGIIIIVMFVPIVFTGGWVLAELFDRVEFFSGGWQKELRDFFYQAPVVHVSICFLFALAAHAFGNVFPRRHLFSDMDSTSSSDGKLKRTPRLRTKRRLNILVKIAIGIAIVGGVLFLCDHAPGQWSAPKLFLPVAFVLIYTVLLTLFWRQRILSKVRISRSRYLPIRINLSSSRTSGALVEMIIGELYLACQDSKLPWVDRVLVESVYKRSRGVAKYIEESNQRIALGNLYGGGSGGPAVGATSLPSVLARGTGFLGFWERTFKRGREYTEHPYLLHDAQRDILRILADFSRIGYKVLFLFDELDKLTPASPDGQKTSAMQKLIDIQAIVSDLKFLLTESHAHYIFIAGKDVDDSWQEDQNKGEGLFESIFTQNIYLPSMLSAQLRATCGPHEWINEEWRVWRSFIRNTPDTTEKNIGTLPEESEKKRKKFVEGIFQILLLELGIGPTSWTYNTGLLILPYFSEHELQKILLRAAFHEERKLGENWVGSKEDLDPESLDHDAFPSSAYVKTYIKWLVYGKRVQDGKKHRDLCIPTTSIAKSVADWKSEKSKLVSPMLYHFAKMDKPDSVPSLSASGDKDKKEVSELTRSTERRCRRIRYILQFLTYKGRGIPRKVLREFYAIVRDKSVMEERTADYWKRRGVKSNIVLYQTSFRQKAKFYANIVSHLENNQDLFRMFDDKGCVSVFHIIDHILKFYQTGFTWSDIENANFMNEREEFFPSRELVIKLLDILEDVLIERIDRRQRTYMLLPRVKHDLAGLYLAFGTEQMELRFTKAEFNYEIHQIRQAMSAVNTVAPAERLESFKILVRLGDIYQLLGDSPEARLAYSRALRWIKLDIERILDHGLAGKDQVQNTSALNLFSNAIEVLQKIGYIDETARDFRSALHHYQMAVRYHEYVWQTFGKEQSLLGTRIAPSYEDPLTHLCESSNHTCPKFPGSRSDCTLGRVYELGRSMVPSYRDDWRIFPFTSQPEYRSHCKDETRSPLPLYTGFDPYGLTRSLNFNAIILEKMWHRYAANRFLLLCLDYYARAYDEYGVVDQMILIGEIMIRRRDFRLAARWYELAMRKLVDYQRMDTWDRTKKQPELQSQNRARLYEFLGDVYYATQGTAFISSERMREARSEGLDVALRERMLELRLLLVDVDMLDDRNEEYFYTQAAQQYAINRQPLRECDVYLKKLVLRQEKFGELVGQDGFSFKMLKTPDCVMRGSEMISKSDDTRWTSVTEELQLLLGLPLFGMPLFDMPQTSFSNGSLERVAYVDDCGMIIRSWCSFWEGAEKVAGFLVDMSSAPRRGEEPKAVVDRRRFGKLYARIGSMITQMATGDWQELIWKSEVDADSLDVHWETERLAYVDRKTAAVMADWRTIRQKAKEMGRKSLTDPMLETMEMHFHNILMNLTDLTTARQRMGRLFGMLVGEPNATFKTIFEDELEISDASLLWELGSNAWSREKTSLANRFLCGQLQTLAKEQKLGESLWKPLRALYMAETAYLCAFVSFDDNIRDLDEAESCLGLGSLYIKTIAYWFNILECLFRREATTPTEKGFVEDFARNYVWLHLSAKRFLAYAIDILRAENVHERCNHLRLGQAYRSLGDLMLIREEVLVWIGTEGGADGSADRVALSSLAFGNRKTVSMKEVQDALKAEMLAQRLHIDDADVISCRIQASESYRQALREDLAEIGDYLKRYRFPNDAYIFHGNIMDRQMHYDICACIRHRHWDYYKKQPAFSAKEAAELLNEDTRELSVHSFEPSPGNVRNQEMWLVGLKRTLDLVCKMSVTPGGLEADSADGRAVVVRFADERKHAEQDGRQPWRFFRSFDDGLARSGVESVPPDVSVFEGSCSKPIPEDSSVSIAPK